MGSGAIVRPLLGDGVVTHGPLMTRATANNTRARCNHSTCQSPCEVTENFLRIASNPASMSLLSDRTSRDAESRETKLLDAPSRSMVLRVSERRREPVLIEQPVVSLPRYVCVLVCVDARHSSPA